MPVLMNRLWRRRLKWHRKRPRSPAAAGEPGLDQGACSLHTLMAAVVVEGRAVPLCWQSYADKLVYKSQNAPGVRAMLLRLKAGAALAPEVRVVMPGRPGVRPALGSGGRVQETGPWSYPGPHQRRRDRQGRGLRGLRGLAWQPQALPDPPGRVCAPGRDVEYRSDGVVTIRISSPAGRRAWSGTRISPGISSRVWTLKRRGAARRCSATSTRVRFDIEELFRDAKNEHLGWSLSKTRIKRADRLDRLILILAVAYLLLVALGLWCRRHKLALTVGQQQPASMRPERAYAIGRVMLLRLCVNLPTLAALLLRSMATCIGNWG